jgi:ADP-ribose pyrophosphatase YjhB (NUDIX family)
MDILVTLHDSNSMPSEDDSKDSHWRLRDVAKVVLRNKDGFIALIGNNLNEYLTLPGGGVNAGEDIQLAAIRECEEETGFVIALDEQLGTTEDYRSRNGLHYINHGFVGTVVRAGRRSPTSSETDVGIRVEWHSVSDALAISNRQLASVSDIKFYNTSFNVVRDHIFLVRADAVIRRLLGD